MLRDYFRGGGGGGGESAEGVHCAGVSGSAAAPSQCGVLPEEAGGAVTGVIFTEREVSYSVSPSAHAVVERGGGGGAVIAGSFWPSVERVRGELLGGPARRLALPTDSSNNSGPALRQDRPPPRPPPSLGSAVSCLGSLCASLRKSNGFPFNPELLYNRLFKITVFLNDMRASEVNAVFSYV